MVKQKQERIYLDHAATTKVKPEVVDAMLPYLGAFYGNPSASYEEAGQARHAVNTAREHAAELINCDVNEIYFTSGGTESDNWAINGAARLMPGQLVTTSIEHHAVLYACEALEKQGRKVVYLPVDENGLLRQESLERALDTQNALVSVMTANNEIGTIQPIEQVASLCRARAILFHTDAVQAFGHLPIDVKKTGIDLLSASAHKLGGPKGVGLLYIRNGINLPSLLWGGRQERHRRAGTENVAGIVGFGEACRLAKLSMQEEQEKELMLREHLITRILTEIPYVRLNGHRKKRLSNNANFSFQFVQSTTMLVMLDMQGICCAGGSACNTGSGQPSHVLMSLGLPEEVAEGSLRITLGAENTIQQIDTVVDCIKKIVVNLRQMSGIRLP